MPQEERQRCEHCNKMRVCRRVRKSKREKGKIIYVPVVICAKCVYDVEIL